MLDRDLPFPDPGDFPLNGNIATETELEHAETLAKSFLEGVTSNIFRTYAYSNGEHDIIFQTIVEDTPGPQQFTVSIGVGNGDLDHPFFWLSVDQDNNLVNGFMKEDDGYHGLVTALDSLLQTEDFDETEELLINHLINSYMMENVINSSEAGGQEFVAQFNISDPGDAKTPLADYIRQMVEAKTVGLRVTESESAESDMPHVLAHSFVGQAMDDEEFEDFPVLQISVPDSETGEVYHYTLETTGARTLVVEDMNQPTMALDLEDIDESMIDDEVEALTEAAGFFSPSQKSVQRLTHLLTRAWMSRNGLSAIAGD
jgi:hypothetical protein